VNSNVPTYGTRPAFFPRAWVQPDMIVTYVEYPEFAEWLRQWKEAVGLMIVQDLASMGLECLPNSFRAASWLPRWLTQKNRPAQAGAPVAASSRTMDYGLAFLFRD
jgi:hypothetical protein